MTSSIVPKFIISIHELDRLQRPCIEFSTEHLTFLAKHVPTGSREFHWVRVRQALQNAIW